MLTNLYISNIVLIDKLDIAFTRGFCVLTGETGAGKSILLDALAVALGKRASSSLIRAGEKQATVIANFDISNQPIVKSMLSEHSIDADCEVIVRRVITEEGKSKSYINDMQVSTNFVNDLAGFLIEIHGQHDQRGLLDQKTHKSILDNYGRHDQYLKNVRDSFYKYDKLQKQLQDLKQQDAKAVSDRDYLIYVLNELNNLAPKRGLEADLTQKRSLLLNREKFVQTINAANEILENSSIDKALRSVQAILLKSSDINSGFTNISDAIERSLIEVDEAISLLSLEANKIEDSEDDLEAIEERLFALKDAAKKYNVTTDDLDEYKEQIALKLDFISSGGQKIDDLEKEVLLAKEVYIKAANNLSDMRVKSAKQLEIDLIKELVPLKMENTKLQINLQKQENVYSPEGFDKVEFYARTNPGYPFAPLAKIASGGELSRFMLALKVVLSDVNSVPTMIFDEVDTGIGGAVSDAVGKRLNKLGNNLQVFAVTHQPQVAAKGDSHYKVQKIQTDNTTTTNLIKLSENERQEELARMLSGDVITDEARNAAYKMLEVCAV
jgi:DNA repair protein RecN (Recombination protein N)